MKLKDLKTIHIVQFRDYLKNKLGLSTASVNRKISSLKRFITWAITNNYLNEVELQQFDEILKNEAKIESSNTVTIVPETSLTHQIINSSELDKTNHKISNYIKDEWPVLRKLLFHFKYSRPKWYKNYHSVGLVHYIHLAVLVIFISFLSFGLYNQLFGKVSTPLAIPSATTNVIPKRYLSFQGRLTDSSGNTISSKTNMRFAIYTSETASGSARLWEEQRTVDPDEDGVFNLMLGSITAIPASLFSENPELWLGITVGRDTEAKPRQRIATVGYAVNAEFLQGHPPSASVSANQIPVMTQSGDFYIAQPNPRIYSASGGFKIEGQELFIQTTNSGDITIRGDRGGRILLRSDNFSNNTVDIVNASIVDGNLLYGHGGNDNTSYNLLKLESGSSPVQRFLVDYAGNASASGDLIIGGIDTTPTISTTNNRTLTIGNSRTGAIILAPGGTTSLTAYSDDITIADTLSVSGNTIGLNNDADADNLIGLSAASGQAGSNLYWGDRLLCDPTIANCGWATSATSYWTRTTGNLYPANSDDTLSATSSAATVATFTATGTNTALRAGGSSNYVTIDTSGNIVAAGTITALTNETINGIDINAGAVSDIDSILGNATSRFTFGGLALQNYNALSDAGTTSHSLSSDNDLYIEGDLEVDGTAYFDGNIITAGSISGFWQRASGVLAPQNITDDLLIGQIATPSSATADYFQVFGTGSTAGDASSSGILTLGINRTSAIIETEKMLPLVLGSATTGSVQLSPKGTTGLFVSGAGNVGIGTTSPTQPLEISNTSPRMLFVETGVTADNGNWRIGADAEQFFMAARNDAGTTSTNFMTVDRTGTTIDAIAFDTSALYIDTVNHFVAINNNTADVMLDVNAANTSGNTVLTGIQLTRTSNSGAGAAGLGGAIDFWLESSTSSTDNQAARIDAVWEDPTNGSADSSLRFNTNFNGTLTEAMRIDDLGKVGIGETAPDGKLQVNGAVVGKALAIFDEDGNQDILVASASGTTRFRIANSGAVLPGADDTYALGSSTLRWSDLYLGPASLHLGTNGNEAIIGYNTTSNYLGFDPDGDANFEVQIDDTGNITSEGTFAVNGDSITSDSNLTINANGYVRIGDSASPGVASGDDDLFIEGDLETDATATIAGTLTVGDGTTNQIRAPFGDLSLAYKSALDTWTNGLTLRSPTGYVGIGTSTPSQLLTLAQGILLNTSGGNPTELGGVEFGASTIGTYVNGKYAFVGRAAASGTCSSSDSTGCELLIYDITKPSSPTFVGGVDTAAAVDGIFATGKYLYFVNDPVTGTCSGTTLTGCEFRIYDISNPSSPTAVNGVDHGDGSWSSAEALAVSGKYAYVGISTLAGTCSTSDLSGCEFKIYNISNPNAIAIVNGLDLGIGVEVIKVSGQNVHIGTGGAVAGTCSGTTVTGCEYKIYNVSDPLNLSAVGGVEFGVAGRGITVLGNYVYIAIAAVSGTCSGATVTGCEFRIYDITDATPTAVSGLDIGTTVAARTTAVAGQYAYYGTNALAGTCSGSTTTGCEFKIVDISNPSSPSEVGGLAPDASIFSIKPFGKYIYIGTGATSGNEFKIVDSAGIIAPAADFGAIAVDDLTVNNNSRIAGALSVGSGLNIGSGGLYSVGPVSILSSGTGTLPAFDVKNSSGTSLFFVEDDGNIGIGTAAPAGPLEIDTGTTSGVAVTIDQDDIDQIALDLDINNTAADIINLDWGGATTQTAALSGINVDMTNLTSVNGSTTYGILVNDLAAQTTSTEYGIYVEGTNWDYGLYVDDAVSFASTATISGTLTVGNGTTNTIQAPFGDLSLAYKSAPDTWTNGLTLRSPIGYVGIGTAAPTQLLQASKAQNALTAVDVENTTSDTAARVQYGLHASGATGTVDVFSAGYTTSGTAIADAMRIQAQSDASGGLILSTATTANIGFYPNLAHAMTIESGGNIGIGTTDPTQLLDVAGNATMSGTLTVGNGTTNQIRSPFGPLSLAYKSALNAWTNGLTLEDTTGDIGIGTTTPAEFLHLSRSDGSNPIRIKLQNTSGTATTTSSLYLGTAATAADSGAEIQGYRTDTGGAGSADLYLRTTSGTTMGTKMTIQANGEVGVGTTDPEALFEVQAVEATDAILALDADDGDDAADTWFIESEAADNDLSIVNGTTEVLNLTSAGALQIDSDLTVSGGDLTLADGTRNHIEYGTAGVSDPSTENGWKIRLYGSGAYGTGNYGIGIDSGTIWLNTGGDYMKWYNQGVLEMQQFQGNVAFLGGLRAGSTTNTGYNHFGSAGTVNVAGDNASDLYVQDELEVDGAAAIAGTLAVGSTATQFKLEVVDSPPATVSAMIRNTNTGTDADGLAISLGFTSSAGSACDTGGGACNEFITFHRGGGVKIGKIHANGTGAVTYKTSGADYAESFQKQNSDEIFLPGEVVSIGTQNHKVVKTTSEYDGKLLGAVSDNAGFSGGYEGVDSVTVGILGQVKVKIANSSSLINQGDIITSSSTVGQATKADQSGYIIGRALEDWNPDSSKDTILVFVDPTWYDPTLALNNDGVLINQESGQIIANEIQASNRLVSPIVETDNIIVQNKLTSPIIETESLEADNASISGTLYAGKIISNELVTEKLTIVERIQEIVKKTVVEDQTQELYAQTTPDSSSSASLNRDELIALINEAKQEEFTNVDSQSFAGDVYVFGKTNLADAFVTGTITQGLTFQITGGNSINVLNGTLYLQSLGGGIDLGDGSFTIDSLGNSRFTGNVSILGELTVNTISTSSESSPSGDLVSGFGKLLIKGDVEITNDLLANNASFSGQLIADSLKLSSDYSATDSGLIIAASQTASSSGIFAPGIKTNGTTGVGIIPAGETEVVVFNNNVSNTKLIYLTPTSDTGNKVLYVRSKKEKLDESDGFFTVAIDAPFISDISFNWWIIN